MLACCHHGRLHRRRPGCNAPENPGCHGLAGLCCPHEDGAMLACCHQGSLAEAALQNSSSSSSLVDIETKRPAACNAPANPGCHGLAGLCCPHEDGAMLACCHHGRLHRRRPGCNAPENPGCHGLAGLCCPREDGAMLACCHQGSLAEAARQNSSSSSSLVDIETERPAACNAPANP